MHTVLTNCNLIDCLSPTPLPNATVVIDDKRISYAGNSPSPSDTGGSRMVDVKGAWVLPGLFDVHSHMVSPVHRPPDEDLLDGALRRGKESMDALKVGVTTLRVVGTPGFVDVAWKKAFESGAFVGPRIFACGHIIQPTGGHGFRSGMAIKVESDGPEGFRRAVREQISNGVDFIKMTITGGIMGPPWDNLNHTFILSDELEAAFQVAHQRGYKVAVHAGGVHGVKAAIQAGAHSVEHGYVLDDEAIAMFVEQGTFWIPTLALSHLTVDQAVTEHEKEYTHRWPIPDALKERANKAAPIHEAGFKKALEAGVKIACGSDTGPPADGALLELGLLVRCGMTPMQAIQAATRTAAEVCCVSQDLGTVERGKLADLVVVDKSPLEDIQNLRQPKMVFKEGALVVDNR